MTRPSRVRRLARLAKAASHGNGGAITADDREEEPPASDDTAHATEENNIPLREAKLLIQKLDELGLGEAIGKEDFLDYYDQLPSPPPWIDLQVELEDGELHALDLRHALYRFRYYKLQLSQQVSKKEQPHHDKSRLLEEDEGWDWEDDARLEEDHHLKSISEEDCTAEFLKEQGYFKHFEEDGTFDWFFHPGYLDCAGLNDYQRLVLQNYGGTEYARWSEYHRYFHSYKIEQEYVKYCEELFKQLKWMEDYLHFDVPSFKWDFISSRGAYQAIKIAATGFHEITPALAYNGYYECTESMSYDLTWFKELDGVYLEIWRRTQKMKSFRDALEEVHNLNRFPLRQHRMKHALEFDDTMEEMKKEYHTCTADITSEVKEDEAQEFIADAVKKLVNKPKTYEQYIKKKIHIARAIGVLPEDLK
uniref:Uncharacterized protein n=1 Tax=Avena sativa TaxID=4498 RepID=A0ACD5TU38_AVESA